MKITALIIFICILSYLFMIQHNPNEIIRLYGFSGENFLHRPWVIFTSIFIHDGLNHLISNMLVLLFFGMALEKESGPVEYLVIFFFGAFVGDIFSLLFYPNSVGVGASAAIFSIIGASIILTPFDLSVYPYMVPLPLGIIGITYAIYNIIEMFNGGNTSIAYAAHFGGLVFGLWYGFKKKGYKKSLANLMILAIMIILLYTAYIYLR